MNTPRPPVGVGEERCAVPAMWRERRDFDRCETLAQARWQLAQVREIPAKRKPRKSRA